MEDLKYIPFYLDWVELMRTKDTDAKKVAFFDAIVDYALLGSVPPAPMDLEDPHGVDYARRDGYLISNRQLDYILPKIRAGASGGKAGTGAAKIRYCKQNASRTQAERKQNASRTQAININNNNIFSLSKERHTPFLDHSFAKFWAAYPSNCPRKTDKKKCRDKWGVLFKGVKNMDSLLTAIMDGLAKWKVCDQWTTNGGQYIRAPLVWLNNRNWEDTPLINQEQSSAGDKTSPLGRKIREELAAKGAL